MDGMLRTGGSLIGARGFGSGGLGGHGGQSPPKETPVEFCFDICLSLQ